MLVKDTLLIMDLKNFKICSNTKSNILVAIQIIGEHDTKIRKCSSTFERKQKAYFN